MKILENAKVRRCVTIWLSIQLTLSMAMVSFADGANYAENAAKWGFDQLFWVVLIITIVVAAGAWVKHSLSTAIVTILVGGILSYLCKQPETISVIGNALGSRFFGG